MSIDRIKDRFSDAQDRLVKQASDLSLESISNMVEGGAIDLEPQFQRRKRWSKKQQSSLIESFLLNIPVPPVYLAENEYGEFSVIDGKQRINSIYNFMEGGLKLKDLEEFDLIEGFKFSELPGPLQNALRVRPYLRVITLLKQSDPTLKYEVFNRLNKGGEQLEPQEIRNVAYRGRLNDTIYELSKNGFLRQQLKIDSKSSSAYEKMKDAEMVLRYFMLLEEWDDFSGSYRDSMDEFMEKHQNDNESKIKEFELSFEKSIRACESIWGRKAFKRPGRNGWRNQLISGMYDAQMIGCSLVDKKTIRKASQNRDYFIGETKRIYEEDEDFETSVRKATNTPNRVVYRIEKIKELLQSL